MGGPRTLAVVTEPGLRQGWGLPQGPGSSDSPVGTCRGRTPHRAGAPTPIRHVPRASAQSLPFCGPPPLGSRGSLTTCPGLTSLLTGYSLSLGEALEDPRAPAPSRAQSCPLPFEGCDHCQHGVPPRLPPGPGVAQHLQVLAWLTHCTPPAGPAHFFLHRVCPLPLL